MSIEQKSRAKRSNWRTHGTNTKRLVLSLSIFGLMLTGCASSPTVIAPECPRPVQVPASILQSDSSDVSDFSKRVQAYLLKVQAFLSGSAGNTTP